MLQETLDRLPAEQLTDLASALDTVVIGLRKRRDHDVSPGPAHIIDEVEAIALRLRYRDQPIEHPAEGRVGDRTYTGVCMTCETFPIEIGAGCPRCETVRWMTVVRS